MVQKSTMFIIWINRESALQQRIASFITFQLQGRNEFFLILLSHAHLVDVSKYVEIITFIKLFNAD